MELKLNITDQYIIQSPEKKMQQFKHIILFRLSNKYELQLQSNIVVSNSEKLFSLTTDMRFICLDNY